MIPKSNMFDKYLKADFVVGDIERLRTEVLKKPSWDAIYALSYGTLVAQKYAWSRPNRVERLILESPVARQRDFRDAERTIVLAKLRNIYNLISSVDSAPCDCTNRRGQLKVEVNFAGILDAGDNFCFLRGSSTPETDNRISTITKKLDDIYKRLEQEYAALGFVTENYDDLKNDAGFANSFPYPEEFFTALRQLQSRGAPQNKNSLLFGDLVRKQIDSAIVAGYYASLSDDEAKNMQARHFPKSQPTDPFLRFAMHRRCIENKIYSKRLDEARNNLSRVPETESERALYVFGLHDGMQPGVFSIINGGMASDEKCITTDRLTQFQSSTSNQHIDRKSVV